MPVAGRSDEHEDRVGNGVASEDAILHLRAPLADMARNLRRIVAHNAEFREEFEKTSRALLDMFANLCGSMREVSYQLHLRTLMAEQAQEGAQSEVSESIQQVARVGEGAEVGIQVETEAVVENTEVAENAEVAEDAEVAENVGTEKLVGEDETMEDA
jgi:hypothetical protein